MILLRALICLSFFSTPLFSQWFWEEHYYEIPFGGEKYYSKGKPRIEGEFTVFNKWPENLEWRIKTQHVKAIKDIGPLSPSEIDAKELTERENLRSIFKVILSRAEVVQKKDSQQAPVSKQTSSSEFDIDVFLNHYSKLNIYSTSDLKIARSRNYSDDEIWAILVKEDSAFSEARKSGFTLDRIAKFFDQEARQ
jgi:hypothetical protein